MKLISAFAASLILVACGGQSSDSTNLDESQQPPISMQASARIVERSTAPFIAIGEKKSYDFFAQDDEVFAKSRLPSIGNFSTQKKEIRLRDITLSFDKDGAAVKLFRLYRAAFGRVPDVRGLGYWRQAMVNGDLSHSQIAAEFLGSPESKILYGFPSSNRTFITKLYQNVLGRAPDTAGAAYWNSELEKGTARVVLLLAFAESTENIESTAADIKKGVGYAEPGIAYLPVSEATGAADIAAGVGFKVDASASHDANDDTLNYTWTLITQPAGSLPWISSRTARTPTVILDKAGMYELRMDASDATGPSFSPAFVKINVHSAVSDDGTYRCVTLSSELAKTLYSMGYTYLDRDLDGTPCSASDLAIERQDSVSLPDSGTYKCSTISHQLAIQLYQQGHTYLDRDHDGSPCEASDLVIETPYTPPVITPPSTGKCWVNGYRRKNGTYVQGYWRRC